MKCCQIELIWSFIKKYKDNEYAIKNRLYEDEVFGNNDKDKELNQAHSIIKAYLSYNYDTHCELLRKEINKKNLYTSEWGISSKVFNGV